MKKGLIIGMILLCVVLIGGCGFLFFYKSKPERVFTSIIEKANKKIKNNIEVNQLKEDIELSIKVEAGEEYKAISDLINNLLLKISVNTDLKTNETNLGLKADYKNKEMANISAYYDSKNVYVNLNDLFDKVIAAELNLDEEKIDINVEDVKNIYNEVFEAFKLAIKEGTYSKKSVDLNGSKVTQNTLTINNENKDKMVNAFVNYLKDSDKFITAVSNLSGESKDEIKKSITEDFKIDKLDKEYNLSIYTKGFDDDFVKFSLGTDKELISFTETSENNYEFKVDVDGEQMTCNIKEENELSSTASCSVDVLGIKVTTNAKVNIKQNEKVVKPNIENTINYVELTKEDMNTIMENLGKKDGFNDFMNVISTLMPTEEPEFDIE